MGLDNQTRLENTGKKGLDWRKWDFTGDEILEMGDPKTTGNRSNFG